MKKIVLLLTLILSTSMLYASFFDTGYVKWKQPNGVEFTARLWGDEFESQMETSNGYRINIGVDNYYYYAELDSNGDYKPSTYRVAIDAPLYSSYHLERSSEWNATLQARIDAFNAQLELNYQAYVNKMASGDSTYKFGVVLVDFTPSEKHIDTVNHPLGYKSAFFDSMIFSRNYWVGDSLSSPHPEHLSLFGSFADYYDDQSNGKIKFVGRDGARKIVNPDTMIGGIGYPRWVVMPNTKGYYASLPWGYGDPVFDSMLVYSNQQLGINLTAVYDKICFIYAGQGTGGGLTGRASALAGQLYLLPEIGDDEIFGQFFSSIGSHVHEMGHLFGLEHVGVGGSADTLGFYWNLMGFGGNGPRFRGACPSALCPNHKVERLHWATYDTINADTVLIVRYDNPAPKLYYVKSKYVNQYFVLENRLRRGFNLYTPHNEATSLPADPDSIDPNHNIGGLLIWRNGKSLMVADRTPTTSKEGPWLHDYHKLDLQRDAFPFNQQDGFRSGLDFNDHTIPSSNLLAYSYLSGGTYSHVAIDSTAWNSFDSSTTVHIDVDYGTEEISTHTTWSGVRIIDRDVVVKKGATLTILPGTTLLFERSEIEKYGIWIDEGSGIIANGSTNSPVTFRSALSNPAKNDWDGIRARPGSTVSLSYCIFKQASVVELFVNNTTLADLTFDSCYSGLSIIGENNHVVRSSFLRAHVRNMTINGNYDKVTACTFSGATSDVLSTDTSTVVSSCDFSSSSFLNLFGTALVKENVFHSSSMLANQGASIITRNLMLGELASPPDAIWINGGSANRPVITNNTICRYLQAITCDAPHTETGYAEPTIKNNILYRNQSSGRDDWLDFKGNGRAVYNCIYNLDSATYSPPDTNFVFDPQFVNPTAGDYRLKYSSPCIDAGDPNDDYSLEPEPNGGRINMGHHGNTENAAGTFNIIASANLTANTTWQNYVIVTNDISTSGHNLTVSPGARVYFDSAKTVTIDGDFTSNGIVTNPIYYRAYRANDVMGGLVITGDDDVSIKYSTFTKAGNALTFSEFIPYDRAILQNLTFLHNTRGIYASKSEITVENSTLDSNQTGLTSQEATVTVTGSTFRHNSAQGAYVFESTAYFDDCTFEYNGLRGVYYQYSSDGSFVGNAVRFNGGSTEDTDLKAGLVFYQSSPAVEGNNIARNYGPGILSLAGSYPVMTLNGVLHNRPSHPSDETNAEILAKDFAVPVIDQGHNDIYDSLGGYYLYHDHEGQSEVMYATENYWGSVDDEVIADAIYPTGEFTFDPYDEEPNTGFAKRLADSLSENLFRQAYQFERDENYPAAMVRYDSILSLYPGTFYAMAALDRIFVVKRKTGVPAAELRSYVNQWTGHDEEPLGRLAKRLSLRCLTLDEQYADAIDNHELWQATTTLVNDSIYSELDILTNELLGSGRLLGKATGATSAMQKSASLSGYERQSEEIIKGLFRSGSSRKTGSLPAVFGLSQNYPNPFNPVTTLKYQLPYDSRVALKVYNVLGQEVKTLVNKSQPAGYYTVQWDGKNRAGHRVSSGIYIYRIVAASGDRKFIKSKKMALIK